MFTTYAIVDPSIGLGAVIYVGQSSNFERRQEQHTTAHRERKPKSGSLQYHLKQMHDAGHKPKFLVLEVVETERQSLASEDHWIEKLAAVGQPLLNRWEENENRIAEVSDAWGSFNIFDFSGEEGELVGTAKPNKRKTGYRIVLDFEEGSLVLDMLPKKQ